MNKKLGLVFAVAMALYTTTFARNAVAAIATPEEPSPCTKTPGTTCFLPWAPRVTIASGLPAVSFRFDGKIGVLDKVVPLELGLNFLQRTYYGRGDAGATRVILWRSAIGVTFGKSPDNDGALFGAYVMPWGIQVNNFSFGLAVGYNAVGKLTSKYENWSVLVPVGYTVQF